jgi:hypothetical protein
MKETENAKQDEEKYTMPLGARIARPQAQYGAPELRQGRLRHALLGG